MGSEVVTKDGHKLYYHPAAEKKYKETVVLVHHMLGNHKTTWRHYRFLNELGFDCITFDLIFGSSYYRFKFHPLLKYFYKGVFYIWTRQLRSVLDQVDGPKIIYGFSGPSLSSFWAADKRNDIVKVVVDGGPFHNVYGNSRNFFYHEFKIKNKYLNAFIAYLGTAVWGYKPLKKLHKILNTWPTKIPIMSIRGGEDQIVSLESIEKVFSSHSNLNLEVLELKHGGHLDGLRDFPKEYCKAVAAFIRKDLKKIEN